MAANVEKHLHTAASRLASPMRGGVKPDRTARKGTGE